MIQEVRRKKLSPYGEYRELEAYQNEWRIAGDDRPCTWSWRYTGGRFERPHLEAYKISVHHSYREGGAVRKRQYSIATMSYYEIAEYSLYDCADSRITATAEKLGLDPAELYEMIESKLEPLRERIEAEFHQSAEYITHQKHRRIIDDHMAAKSKFCSRYGVDEADYNRCYDVFGTLRNKEYLAEIKAQHKGRKESERRYRESWRSTYERYTGGSYSVPSAGTYTEGETAILKQFYRSLSKTYHPDLNPNEDTTEAMKLLNRLKEQWGL